MNIIKSITASVAIAVTTSIAFTASAEAQVKRGAFEIPNEVVSGVLIADDGAFLRCIVLGAKGGKIFYKTNFNSAQTESKSLTMFSGVYFFDPPAFAEAKKLFRDRKYKEAIPKFEACKEYYKLFRELDNNFHDLAVYYQLECYRKLQDYAAIDKILELFISEKLTRPSHQTQMEVYKLWSAVNTKSWGRLKAMCLEWRTKKVPIGVRAQIAFCEGLAHEGLGETSEALNAYAMAMTADFTKSDAIVRQAALNSLRIYAADEEVKTAMKVWKTEYEEKNKPGYIKLGEANALARIYDRAGLGAGVELPAEYKKFQTFTTDEMAARLKEKAEAGKE